MSSSGMGREHSYKTPSEVKSCTKTLSGENTTGKYLYQNTDRVHSTGALPGSTRTKILPDNAMLVTPTHRAIRASISSDRQVTRNLFLSAAGVLINNVPCVCFH